MFHRKSLFVIVILILFLVSLVYAQNPEWVVYNTSNSGLPSNNVRCIAMDNNGNKWIGTGDHWVGCVLTMFDGTHWTVYDTSNSGLPHDYSVYITAISIDKSGNKWIGTGHQGMGSADGAGLVQFDGNNWTIYSPSDSTIPGGYITSIVTDSTDNLWVGSFTFRKWSPVIGGLSQFNGTNWTVYNTSNSGLPSNRIHSITIDDNGRKWIGIGEYDFEWGLTKFDGSIWMTYNTSNSGLPYGSVNCLTIDGSGNLWMACAGLIKFDGNFWTVYNTSNSGMPSNEINCISIDANGDKWIGTASFWNDSTQTEMGGGMAQFDGSNWKVYDTSNSGLPSDDVLSIAIDASGNKWIGTDAGLAVFKEGGVVGIEVPVGINSNPKSQIPTHITLYQNYPNPFNPSTTIEFTLPRSEYTTLKIYNIIGAEVATLVSGELQTGLHKYQFDGSKLASGVYIYRLVTESGFSATRKFILIK